MVIGREGRIKVFARSGKCDSQDIDHTRGGDRYSPILPTTQDSDLCPVLSSTSADPYHLSYDHSGLLASVSGTKFHDGTIALRNSLRDHGRAELRLQKAVTAIKDEGSSVAVGLSDGTELRAKAVIVTVPLNALADVQFSPALDSSRQRAISQRHGGSGTKIFARVAVDTAGHSILAPQRNRWTGLSRNTVQQAVPCSSCLAAILPR